MKQCYNRGTTINIISDDP